MLNDSSDFMAVGTTAMRNVTAFPFVLKTMEWPVAASAHGSGILERAGSFQSTRPEGAGQAHSWLVGMYVSAWTSKRKQASTQRLLHGSTPHMHHASHHQALPLLPRPSPIPNKHVHSHASARCSVEAQRQAGPSPPQRTRAAAPPHHRSSSPPLEQRGTAEQQHCCTYVQQQQAAARIVTPTGCACPWCSRTARPCGAGCLSAAGRCPACSAAPAR